MQKGRILNIFYILLIIGALFGIAKLKQDSKKNVEKIIAKTKIEAITESKKDFLLETLKKGLSAKCQFAYDVINSKVTSTLYVTGDAIRTDITAPDKNDVEKLTHTIIKAGYMYLWYDKSTSGIKIRMGDKTNDTALKESTSSQALVMLNLASTLETFDYKCEEWEKDNFMFVLPPEVTFIDGNELNDEISSQLCQKCEDETTEASRLLCKRELKCNR